MDLGIDLNFSLTTFNYIVSIQEGVLKKRRSRDQGKWSTLAFYKDDKLVLMKFDNDQVIFFNISQKQNNINII